MKRRRTGISEVIAALLILVISVTIGTLFFAYGSSVLGLTQSDFIQQTALSRDKIEERLVITSVFHNSSGGNTSVFIAVFNYGMRTATISTVYLNTTNVYEFGVSPELEIRDTNLGVPGPPLDEGRLIVGGFAWIKVTDYETDLGPGIYRIIVVTERGNGFEARYEI